MLIRFTVENFLSFKERQTFSLIPGKGTLKADHKATAIDGIAALKTAVIFGANASGKSNLVKAIDFGKKLILAGTKLEKELDFQHFRLDKDYVQKNSRIEYEIQHKGKNYAYGFVFNKNEIVEEWLYLISKKSDTKIFERDKTRKDIYDLKYLEKRNKKGEERQFLKFTAKATPDNQLFLNEIRTRKVRENVSNIEDLWAVLDWFENALKVIFPDDKYNEGLKFELKEDDKLLTIFEKFLSYFDTGIHGVCLEPVEKSSVKLPTLLIEKIKEDLLNKHSESVRASILSTKNTTYFISTKDEEIVFHKFMTKHPVVGQEETALFDTRDESDGTNRIIDFIPILMDLLNGDNVFIIDEMERSLHPNLIYDLLDLFLSLGKNINSQLILASHETTLLTQKLLRKDEVWFAVKDEFGASQLHSLQEYNIRFDKQIAKDYLIGRYKGIPRLGSRRNLMTYAKNG